MAGKNRLIRIVFISKEWVRVTAAAIFYKSERNQLPVFFIAVMIIVIALVFTDPVGNSAKAFSTLIGIGTSLLVAAALLKVLSGEKQHLNKEIGLCFFGNRDAFKMTYKRSSNDNNEYSGWNKWISETPWGGEIIIVGKKNSHWLKESCLALLEATKRNITIRFVFQGTEDDVKINIQNFVLQENYSQISVSNNISLEKSVLTEGYKEYEDNAGYYWNGITFIAKLYLPHIDNEKCPLVGFALPGVSCKFSYLDIDNNLFLPQKECVKTFARSFNKILEKVDGI